MLSITNKPFISSVIMLNVVMLSAVAPQNYFYLGAGVANTIEFRIMSFSTFKPDHFDNRVVKKSSKLSPLKACLLWLSKVSSWLKTGSYLGSLDEVNTKRMGD
jgi:hypothetical protein